MPGGGLAHAGGEVRVVGEVAQHARVRVGVVALDQESGVPVPYGDGEAADRGREDGVPAACASMATRPKDSL
ncbi:hypothetical protein SHKM778_90580 [Streptomyces sp. KM77-8]|uniref:Uncharacterized protein n=1 Tax=Streptomyces haneummycinicus TaxID=3074435 RepID=A0AAT9HZK5_9ACTN